MDKARLKRIAKFSLKLAVAAVAIYFVLSNLDRKQLVDLFSKIQVAYLIPAALLFILSKTVSAFRLNYYFRATGLVISHVLNLRLYLLGMFYNLFLPGGIGGDGYKVWWLNKHHGGKTKSLIWASLLDRVSGLAALVALALVCAAITLPELWMKASSIGLIAVMYATYYFVGHLFFRSFQPVFFRAGALSLCVQGLQVGSAFCLLMALQAYAQTAEYLLLFLITSIFAIVPVTPGAIGLREFVSYFGSGELFIDENIAVSVSLAFNLITILVSFAGIYFVLRPGSLSKGES